MGSNEPMNKNVLIVDDELLILKVLRSLFSTHGYTPFCAQSGKVGLSLMKEHSIRVVFTDLRMPGMDGMELCRQAKQLDSDARIHTISAYVGAYEPEQFEEAGFSGVFGKPYNIDLLLRACQESFLHLGIPSGGDLIESDSSSDESVIVTMHRETLVSIIHSEKDRNLIGRTFACKECSVSSGGIQFLADIPFLDGTDVGLNIAVDGSSKPFLMTGIVSSMQKDNGSSPKKRELPVSIQFDLSSPDIEMWRTLVIDVSG